MFDNMIGAVGFAMHEDRLAKAAKNLRRAEATRGRQGLSGAVQMRYREEIAAALVALATRIAPSLALAGGQTRMAPQ
ncbi:MAG: hypothetical protein M3Y58_16125 [Chloroflexota bacterium]|nr:hypothetical protein [Chloroflexota bacterium]